jgi:XTP/dITP diphosphohydrolase
MNKKLIYFVSTSKKKFEHLNTWIKELDPSIDLQHWHFEIPEIQDVDVKKVAHAKAYEACKTVQSPLLVDDEGVYLDEYPLFPGTVSKQVVETIGVSGLLKLIGDNRRAWMINCLAYIDDRQQCHIFDGVMYGTLTDGSPEQVGQKLTVWDVFVPEGHQKSSPDFEDVDAYKHDHYRYKSLQKFVDWFKKSSQT